MSGFPYLVQDFKKHYSSSDQLYNLPNNIIFQNLGIAFSHIRALLNTELQSTVYVDKFELPVINPAQLLAPDKDGTK